MTGSNNVQNNGKRYVDRIYGNTGDFDRSTINDLTVSNKADVKPILKIVDIGKSGYKQYTQTQILMTKGSSPHSFLHF